MRHISFSGTKPYFILKVDELDILVIRSGYDRAVNMRRGLGKKVRIDNKLYDCTIIAGPFWKKQTAEKYLYRAGYGNFSDYYLTDNECREKLNRKVDYYNVVAEVNKIKMRPFLKEHKEKWMRYIDDSKEIVK